MVHVRLPLSLTTCSPSTLAKRSMLASSSPPPCMNLDIAGWLIPIPLEIEQRVLPLVATASRISSLNRRFAMVELVYFAERAIGKRGGSISILRTKQVTE